MNQIYFFDDFLIRRTHETKRVFHTPEWKQDCLFMDENSSYGTGFSSVVPAPIGGYYLYYTTLLTKDEDAFDHCAICLAHSIDGLHWASVDLADKAGDGGKNVLNLGKLMSEGASVCFDPEETNPNRRYKLTNSPFGRENPLGKRPPCILYDSPDGLVWTADTEHELLPSNSDTMLNLIKNHRTGKYQVTLRRRWGERRVFLTESKNGKEWNKPRLILHPLPTDPPMTHLYGLAQFAYQDMFAGFLWKLRMPYNGLSDGPVTTELVYSYDGRCWNRTNFDLMPLQEIGTYGGGSMYGTAMLETDEHLIVYAMATLEQHHRVLACMKENRRYIGLLPGFLRKEGFVGLAADAAMGEITTELLKLYNPNLTVNIKAPFGGVRFQIVDEKLDPIEGYTFADSEEITGDFLAAPIRWKNRADLSEAMKLPWIRLMIRMEQAELFAIHGDFVFTINPFAPIEEFL